MGGEVAGDWLQGKPVVLDDFTYCYQKKGFHEDKGGAGLIKILEVEILIQGCKRIFW